MEDGSTKFVVKKRKDEGGKTFWKEVGTVVVNTSEGTGALYLHLLDGSFRLFSDEYYERKAKEKESQHA